MVLKYFLASALLLNLSSCQTPGGDFPEWHGKLWNANADREGIERTQDNEFISAGDPLFNQYICTSQADLMELYQNMLKCKKWSK